jgi:hypothetical protein
MSQPLKLNGPIELELAATVLFHGGGLTPSR